MRPNVLPCDKTLIKEINNDQLKVNAYNLLMNVMKYNSAIDSRIYNRLQQEGNLALNNKFQAFHSENICSFS